MCWRDFAGNTNFGEAYCLAGDIISQKVKVPHMYRFELLARPGMSPKCKKG